MAKGARSNRKKALRTVRRDKVSATWQEEAELKRLEALRRCMEAPPVPLSEDELARMAEAKAKAAEAMDADDGGAAAAAARGGKKGGGKKGGGKKGGGKKGVAVGGRKGRKKQVGVLSSMSGNKFHKMKRKAKK
ncbi:hypothetical protein Rsub_00141 [Raphidocelis subcapitata]|uniref:Uncharacterized protein n=1 Tax=Raphidocelis subcapitata TaxID=307507 RepID=A0A2V0NPK2_9CHLO|nr:hypothetical protein Rsub_00141 [Raphidocelis subcapitata]|eukprot:GBF87430.1 hypothetical protein Rsub_00141 [Raphidocelis subcapitata]